MECEETGWEGLVWFDLNTGNTHKVFLKVRSTDSLEGKPLWLSFFCNFWPVPISAQLSFVLPMLRKTGRVALREFGRLRVWHLAWPRQWVESNLESPWSNGRALFNRYQVEQYSIIQYSLFKIHQVLNPNLILILYKQEVVLFEQHADKHPHEKQVHSNWSLG